MDKQLNVRIPEGLLAKVKEEVELLKLKKGSRYGVNDLVIAALEGHLYLKPIFPDEPERSMLTEVLSILNGLREEMEKLPRRGLLPSPQPTTTVASAWMDPSDLVQLLADTAPPFEQHPTDPRAIELSNMLAKKVAFKPEAQEQDIDYWVKRLEAWREMPDAEAREAFFSETGLRKVPQNVKSDAKTYARWIMKNKKAKEE